MVEEAVLFWRAMVGRAYPRLVGMNREPSWIFFDVLLPMLSVAGYVFLYKALGAPEEFVGFVVLGGAMTAYWLNVLWSMASQLYWDKESGNLSLYMMAPTSRMAILLGMAVGGLYATSLRAAAVVGASSLLFGVRYQIDQLPLAMLVFLVTLAALYGLGMMFSSLFLLYGREAWHLNALLQEPVYLASGFYFPVRSLGVWLAGAAAVIPLTLGLDAMRQLLFGEMLAFGLLPPVVELALLAVLAVLFLFGARSTLGFMEERSKREGRLTLKNQ